MIAVNVTVEMRQAPMERAGKYDGLSSGVRCEDWLVHISYVFLCLELMNFA